MTPQATGDQHLTAQNAAAPLLDVVIAAAAFTATLIMIMHGGGVPDAAAPLDPTRIILAACATAPLIAWRRWPLAVFVITALASVLLAWHGSAGGFTPGPVTALFLLAASRTRHTPWTAHTTVTVITLFAAYLAALTLTQQALPGIEILHASLAWAVAWFAGDRSRLRREQITDLQQRAERAEQDTQRERQLAVAEERARIARDLHDSAAHAISLIAMRAGTARLRHHLDPRRSAETLHDIEELARQTVAEIDHIVGNLREHNTSDAVEAPPGLASLDTLIADHAQAGLHVTLTRSGDPGMLHGAADQAVYRILQEALTNAARYGNGHAEVTLNFTGNSAELTVTNAVGNANTPDTGGGHGLIGMRERAALLGGSLDTGNAGGIFRVRARVPYSGQRP